MWRSDRAEAAVQCDVQTVQCISDPYAWTNCATTTLDGGLSLGTYNASVRDVPVHMAIVLTTTTNTHVQNGATASLTGWSVVWRSGGTNVPRLSPGSTTSLLFPEAGLYEFTAYIMMGSGGAPTSHRTWFSPAANLPSVNGYAEGYNVLQPRVYIRVTANEEWVVRIADTLNSFSNAACNGAGAQVCYWYVRRVLV